LEQRWLFGISLEDKSVASGAPGQWLVTNTGCAIST
jgi:hypothetical protein